MKRNDWKLITGSLIFTYLFYHQEAGINFLIFGALASLFLALNNPERILKPSVIVSFIGLILSGVFVFIYGTTLPIISFIISLSLMSAFIFEPETSLILSGFHGFISVLLAVPKIISDLFSREAKPDGQKNILTKFFLLFIPLIITLIFFLLYRIANPNFLEFTKDLNFDWLSLPLLRFFIISFLVMYGLLTRQVINFLQEKDLSKNDEIIENTEALHLAGSIGKRINMTHEIFIGASLLIMLNILLAVVNGIDLVKLWPNPILPENQDSFSQYLHSGIQTLIISIIFAVAIIMFFFRGYFNYFKETKFLKILGYFWIIQNVILLISTAIRNNMYVEAYGLSHKRIGVFVYLGLAVIGLVITFIKLLAKKNNTFLFRKNAWAFYIVLLLATPISWDQIITDYNIQLAANKNKKVDYKYLAKLSHMNIAQIIPQFQMNQEEMFLGNGLANDTNYYLNGQLLDFLKSTNNEAFPSTCISKKRNLQAIEKMHKNGQLTAIVLNHGSSGIESILRLQNLKSLVIDTYDEIEDWHLLAKFKKLELLNTRNSYFDSLDSLPAMENLKYLNIENNYIYELKNLKRFPSLVSLNIRGNNINNYTELAKLPLLKNLYVDDLTIADRETLALLLPNTNIFYGGNQAYRN